MKKLLLLSALLIFACSSDDSSDTNNNNFEPIIGVWNLYYEEFFSDMSNSWVDSTTDGIQSVSTTFFENGEFSYHIFNISQTYTGVWENLGNNIYRIETNMVYQDGVLFSEDVNIAARRILFYCDNNIMRWDMGYEGYESNSQLYMSKDSYNPQNCNEAPYNAN